MEYLFMILYYLLQQMLIAKGSPLMEKDEGGDGPMHWAAKRGDLSILCTMKTAGACPMMPGDYPIPIRNVSFCSQTSSFAIHT